MRIDFHKNKRARKGLRPEFTSKDHIRSLRPAQGSMLLYLVIIIFIFSVVMLPILGNIVKEMQVLRSSTYREEALQIADAGVNYYQWHLAHFPTDYQDGTAAPGPYVHDYVDTTTQQTIGKFSLAITAPALGSTIVTIKSTGWTNSDPDIKRTVTARYGIPSLAKYAFLSNDVVWIGSQEIVSGTLMSNNGVRFDGTTNAPVESAKSTYTCPSSQGSPCPATENGVWGAGGASFWQYPVPAVDFSSLTATTANLQNLAQNGGIFLPPSNKDGYSLVFNGDGTVSIYVVTSTKSNPKGWDVYGKPQNQNTDYNNRTLLYTDPIPSNGIIYVEDTIWVEGTVNGRATVAAGMLPYNPNTAPSIYIPNSITYAAKDGSDVLGLIAQNNIALTYHAPADMEVDAVLVAENGSVQFFYYPDNVKDILTVFGSIITYGQWTWTWLNGQGQPQAGYETTYDTYDANLLYNPPPSFPLSNSGYQLLSWSSN